jgi:rubrerythrin
MKTKVYIGAALAGTLLFAAGHLTATGGGLSQKTQENLSTAMHGEAFAYAKYMLYAKHAEQNGNAELAKLFTTAARIERFQHFGEEAQLTGLVGSDADNLKDAIKGESYEVETMYRQFLRSKLPQRETKRLPTDLKKYVTTKLAIAMSSKLRLAISNSRSQEAGKYLDRSPGKDAHHVGLAKTPGSRSCNRPRSDPSL